MKSEDEVVVEGAEDDIVLADEAGELAVGPGFFARGDATVDLRTEGFGKVGVRVGERTVGHFG